MQWMKLKFNYYSRWVGGWSDKTKLILISTLVEVLVEVELGNYKSLPMENTLLCSISRQENYQKEEAKAENNDVDNLWKEIKSLGKLPVNQKDETLKEVTSNLSNISSTISFSKRPEKSNENEAETSVISIPILREEKAKDENKCDENEDILNKQVINLKIKETDIVTEKPAAKKQLKSSLKSGNKTQIPITIKIPIKHEKSSLLPPGVCMHACQEDENGPVNSVSTQTDKSGCLLM